MRAVALLFLAACERSYSLDELPVTEWTAGLPVSGDGKLVVALSPKVDPETGAIDLRGAIDWRTTHGHVDFRCDGCALGDDKTKIQLDPAFFGDAGVDFRHLTFDTIRARADFDEGRMHLATQWRSPGFTLDAEVDAVLATTASESEISGCVVFRVHDVLRERDPRMHALLSISGAPLDERGNFTISLEGTLGGMRKLGKICELPAPHADDGRLLR